MQSILHAQRFAVAALVSSAALACSLLPDHSSPHGVNTDACSATTCTDASSASPHLGAALSSCYEANGDLLVVGIPGAGAFTSFTVSGGWSSLLDVAMQHQVLHDFQTAQWAESSGVDNSGGPCTPVRMSWDDATASVLLSGWTCQTFGATAFTVSEIRCAAP